MVDTRGVLNADWKRLYNASKCGETMTAITQRDAYTITWTCKTWDCKTCVDHKISDIKFILNQNIHGPHVFVTQVERAGERLSKWIDRNKPRVPNLFYLAIRTASGARVISSHLFSNSPDTQRAGKKKYVEKDLHNYLTEHQREVIRISHSREGFQKWPRPIRQPLLARIFGDRIWEWKKLKTDRERAEWLDSTPGIHLRTAGREFIREHLGGDNRSM